MDRPVKGTWMSMIGLLAWISTGQSQNVSDVQCGGLLTSSYGVLKSPGYPNNYPINVNCHWTISASPEQMIDLRFYRVDIEGSSSSCNDFIRVYDGETSNSSLLVRLCGAMNQSEVSNLKVRSTGNRLHVYFSSDNDGVRQGFIATYTFQGCDPWTHGYGCFLTCTCVRNNTASCSNRTGYCTCMSGWTGSDCSQRIDPCLSNRCPATSTCLFQGSGYTCLTGVYSTCNTTITSTNGYISSPYYPKNYLDNTVCTWTISAPVNTIISLSILDFALEENSKCTYDSLEVYDGAPTGRLIGKYCGANAQNFIQSTTNSMRLTFKTDSSFDTKGFIASFTTHYCSSFTYGFGCARNCNCVQSNTDNCDRLSGICVCKAGWTGVTCAEDVNECLGQSSPSVCPVNSECVNTNGSYVCNFPKCNKMLTNSSGVIMSPNYPLNYENSAYCTWTILSNQTGAIITVNISSYNVEGCPYDFLSMYDGNNANASKLGTYCSTAPGIVSSTGPSMHLVFVTDASATKKGFIGSYSVQSTCRLRNCSHSCQVVSSNPRVEQCVCPEWARLDPNNSSRCIEINACNSSVTASSGYIVSPGYPNAYSNNLNCYWIIVTTPGKQITFGFFDINVEQNSDCSYDSVKIFNGNSNSSPCLGQFCGDSLPFPVRSSGQYIYILFKTDQSVTARGFKAQFNTL